MKGLVLDLVNKISKERLEKLYIQDNLRKEVVAEQLGVTMWTLTNLLNYQDLKEKNLIIFN